MTNQDLQAMNQAIALAQTGLKDDAHAALSQLLQKYPTEPNLLLWLAFTSNNQAQAESFLKRAEQADPQNPTLANARSWVADQFANRTASPPTTPVATEATHRPDWLAKVDPITGHDPYAPTSRLPMPLPRLLIFASIAILLVAALIVGLLAFNRYSEQKEFTTEVDFANWSAGGVGVFTYTDKLFPDKPIKVWYYRPANLPKNAPLVFTLHGSDRDGQTTRNRWLKVARDYKVIVFAPEFSYQYYNDTAYNLGGVIDDKLRQIPEARWTFNIIENIFDYTKQTYGYSGEQYYLYGLSAGAQFVHRFVLLKPQARYAKVALANAGFYTLPRFEDSYPYGLNKSGATPATQKTVLGKDFHIFLGDQDTQPTDLDGIEEVRKQGPNRLARGETFYGIGQVTAEQLKTPFGWKKTIVPGVAHEDYDIIPLVAESFWGKKP